MRNTTNNTNQSTLSSNTQQAMELTGAFVSGASRAQSVYGFAISIIIRTIETAVIKGISKGTDKLTEGKSTPRLDAYRKGFNEGEQMIQSGIEIGIEVSTTLSTDKFVGNL